MTYTNEPVLELERAGMREQLMSVLSELDASLPLRVPVTIDGVARDGDQIASVDPGRPQRVVAHAAAATTEEVDCAVRAAAEAQRAWGDLPVGERAALLLRAADALRARRLRLCALAVRECGKPWAEADGEVSEAIDFLTFYAREAVALDGRAPLLQMPGERNVLYYRPRGVVAVIAPWNFPLAIAAGMTAAALVTGNAVCLKPAEQSPACALALAEVLWAAGVPSGALALLPGEGDVGAALVAHPGVHTIAFTGSSAVGLEIQRVAAELAPGQRHIKHVVAEMGGKNCIVVDADTELDEVVPAIVRSAFGFAGQKCSAASLVLAHERISEPLVERLHEALGTLRVGQAQELDVDVPPLIEATAQARVEQALATSADAGATVRRGVSAPTDGYFVSPAVVTGAPAGAPVLERELFGPVIAVEAVDSVAAACAVVAALPYALTGGICSHDPQAIAAFVQAAPVGNVYVNRHITGAMVGRQPFGGNRLSGTGAKAGGSDYLLHFVEPVVVTENTVRHGLAV